MKNINKEVNELLDKMGQRNKETLSWIHYFMQPISCPVQPWVTVLWENIYLIGQEEYERIESYLNTQRLRDIFPENEELKDKFVNNITIGINILVSEEDILSKIIADWALEPVKEKYRKQNRKRKEEREKMLEDFVKIPRYLGKTLVVGKDYDMGYPDCPKCGKAGELKLKATGEITCVNGHVFLGDNVQPDK